MLGSYHFVYNGKNSAEFNVIVCEIGGSSSTSDIDLGLKRTIVEDKLLRRRAPLFYGVKKEKRTSLEFTLVKGATGEGEAFEISEVRDIARWLFAPKAYCWFQLCGLNLNQPEYQHINYHLLFTDIQPVMFSGRTIGLKLFAECDSSFAWSDVVTYCCDSLEDATTTYMMVNNSDDGDYIYPAVKIDCYENTDVKIVNESENDRETLWTNVLASDDGLVIDGENGVCIPPDGMNLNGFNFKFFRLVPGENIVTLKGAFRAQFSYREPIIVNYD